MLDNAHLMRNDHPCLLYQFFFKQLRDRFGMKPILTDGSALWYNLVYSRLRLEHHQVYDTGKMKNIIERFNKYIKERTECFDDHFPYRKKSTVIDSTYGTG
jgi:transposase-like protein